MRLIRPLFIVFVLVVILAGLVLAGLVAQTEIALAQTGDPVLVAAGDIANCNRTQDELTAQLLDGIAGTVVTLGDNAYPDGTLTQFTDCYGPNWGRFKDRTRPAPGNHDYHTPGAEGYYTYFGAAASPLDTNCTSNCRGYYSYNLGTWHIIALNSEIPYGAGSAQEQWLRADLAANQRTCTLAYWHRPRFSSGRYGNNTSLIPLWQALYDYGADIVLNGHNHAYERFALQSPTGQADPSRGIREFVVGTGGAGLYTYPITTPVNSEVRSDTWGVLKLTLHSTSYDWQFIPIAGQTFADAGSANCVGAVPTPTATRPPTGTPPTATSTPTPTATRTPTIAATGTPPTATSTPTPGSSDQIFADGFESGNLSAWTSNSNDLGDLSVSTTAGLVGSRGLQAVIDDLNLIHITDDTPNAEPRYRARFYFDPNSISMTNLDSHIIFFGYAGPSPFTPVLRVGFRFASGAYQLRASLWTDSAVWTDGSWFNISDAPHFVEVDWRAASATGANNGGLTLWIDGVQRDNLSGVDNDIWRIDRVRLGAVDNLDIGTSGRYYLDAFESRRQTYIGPVAGGPTATASPSPTNTPTATNTPIVGATPTNTPTRTPTPNLSDLIFYSGVENGQLLAWSSSITDAGDLSATTMAALVGNYGIQAVIDDNNAIYVADDTPNAEPRYRARFYFDPNLISMVDSDTHVIFNGYTTTTFTGVLRVEFNRSLGNYQVRARLLNDSAVWTNTSWFTISDARHFIELDWRAATAVGANNGSLTLWIDGTQQANLTGVDNDTHKIERIRLGAVTEIDTGTRGIYYFDAFESRRQTYIGPAPGALTALPSSTELLAPTSPYEVYLPILWP
jgi:hypothetical protein